MTVIKQSSLWCAVFLGVVVSAAPCQAQTALQELERRLFGGGAPPTTPAAPPVEAPPAPAEASPAMGAAYLGFRGESSPQGGVDVLTVDAGGPAKVAGMQSGDRIVRFDGADIADLNALARVVGRVRPRQLISVRMYRGDSQITTTLRVGSASNTPASTPSTAPATPSTSERASLGVSVIPVTDSARRTYGLPVRRGALVTAVTQAGPAARAGIPVGSAIVAVDGRQITQPSELIDLVQRARPGQVMQLSLYEGSRLASRRVQLEGVGGDVAAAPSGRGGLFEGRLSEGGRRPVLGALGRILDDVVRDPPAINVGPTAAPPAPVEPVELAPREPDQMQILIDEMRALRLTVERLEERVRQLESSERPEPPRSDDATLELKSETPPAPPAPPTEALPEPKSP